MVMVVVGLRRWQVKHKWQCGCKDGCCDGLDKKNEDVGKELQCDMVMIVINGW